MPLLVQIISETLRNTNDKYAYAVATDSPSLVTAAGFDAVFSKPTN